MIFGALIALGTLGAAQASAPTRGTLVIGILTVESSYAENLERPARGVPDSIQFWIGPGGAWRIRTYAIDHDIHPHSLGDVRRVQRSPTEFARSHIKKHYADVLARVVVLELPDISDGTEVRRRFSENNLSGTLEVAKNGFAFWNPDDGEYKSRTTPK